MKKIGLFLICLLCSIYSQAATVATLLIGNGGLNQTYTPQSLPDVILLTGSGFTLSNNVSISVSPTPPNGTKWCVYTVNFNCNLNGNSFFVFGQAFIDDPLYLNVAQLLTFTVVNNAVQVTRQPRDFYQSGGVPGDAIAPSIPLNSLSAVNSGNIIVGNSSNKAASVSVTGDVTINNTGVTNISSGVIVNADINASAAIARSKIASGTASQVVTNDVSGNLSSEATLNPLRGGLGTNASSSTGYVTFSSGSATIGAVTDSKIVPISFEATSELGDVKIYWPFSATVTGIYAEATKTIEATDSATITPKNNGGTIMGSGTITLPAGTTIGTAVSSTPSTNNAFTAGQIMTLTTNKGTAGGKALLTITYTRTGL
jgi:hypothetical protein